MTMQSTIGRCSAKLRQFRSASGANVTIMFALSLVPVLGAVGAAVDYSQGSSLGAHAGGSRRGQPGHDKRRVHAHARSGPVHRGGDIQRIVQSASTPPAGHRYVRRGQQHGDRVGFCHVQAEPDEHGWLHPDEHVGHIEGDDREPRPGRSASWSPIQRTAIRCW